jgi:hypothetical protein
MAQNKDISFNRDHSVTDDSVCIGRRHTLWTRTVLPVLSRHLHLSSNTKVSFDVGVMIGLVILCIHTSMMCVY